jgi:hypothetical protein
VTAGAGPLHEGDPGYSLSLDGDGVACEQPGAAELEAETLAIVRYLVAGGCPSDQIFAEVESSDGNSGYLVMPLDQPADCITALADVTDFLAFSADWADQAANAASWLWSEANEADTWLIKTEPWCGPVGCESKAEVIGAAVRLIDLTEGKVRPLDLVEAVEDTGT